MRVKVISRFRDKYAFDTIHEVGEEIEVDKERAEDLILRHLAESLETAPVEVVVEDAPKPQSKPRKRKNDD